MTDEELKDIELEMRDDFRNIYNKYIKFFKPYQLCGLMQAIVFERSINKIGKTCAMEVTKDVIVECLRQFNEKQE